MGRGKQPRFRGRDPDKAGRVRRDTEEKQADVRDDSLVKRGTEADSITARGLVPGGARGDGSDAGIDV